LDRWQKGGNFKEGLGGHKGPVKGGWGLEVGKKIGQVTPKKRVKKRGGQSGGTKKEEEKSDRKV